ncbi:MAG: dimethyl sulfoxide reductase anchor subunit [Rhodobacteraceae bacterium]|nr:dimethyl sulfoxide reductase anchor subunit [Paracoccaceae bacterium]
MHPAYSVILFTTASGAGYGLLFWIGLAEAFGAMPGGRWIGFAMLTVALALITVGLLASTLHLGHPERALGAFSQWRSSWLSREAVAAVVTYIPAGLLWLVWLAGVDSGATPALGVAAAAGAGVTVYCTGMIYAALRTIRQWHRPVVPVIYLALASGTGALLLGLMMALAGFAVVWTLFAALVSLTAAGLLKLSYWQQNDGDPGRYTAEMATGLGHLGTVRPLDPPHSMPNFVMREMGFSVARKHALTLRRTVLICLFGGPLGLIVLSMFTPYDAGFMAIAVLAAGIGVITERWLFFAEAEHVSMLYYGAARA